MPVNRRLLIVDDDPLNTKTLAEIFRLEGYEVDAVEFPMRALEMVQKTHYTVILSDIKMDQLNGVELLKMVKAIQPEIHFILMTAYTDDDLIMEGIRAGALVTLIKPLDIEKLLAQVDNLIHPVRHY